MQPIDSAVFPSVSIATASDLPGLLVLWQQQASIAAQPAFRLVGALEQLIAHPERGCCLVIRDGSAPAAAIALSFFISLHDGGRCALITDGIAADAQAPVLLDAAIGYASAHGILQISLADGAFLPAIAASVGFARDAVLWRHRAPASGKQLA